MTLTSMTGFGHAEGQAGAVRFTWELRSVNGRGLDLRLRLPGGLEHLDAPVRAALTARLRRGNVQAGLQLRREAQGGGLVLNEAALERVLAIVETVRKRTDAPPPSVEGLLALRGVLEVSEAEDDEAVRAERDAALMAGLAAALDQLVLTRAEEGASLAAVLAAEVEEITALAAMARALAPVSAEGQRARLLAQLSGLLEADPPLPEERLAQELALLAVRTDVREELDRLEAHCAAARDLLASGEPVGRRLEFLAQEFQREANTLCSKATDIELTRTGLALKAVIDQLREQVQNVE
ncbi:MAG: YicC family protein [Alphaproteobacteria bacterium]|nr:YicC family protein [Alphaproteobacteria bacterium]